MDKDIKEDFPIFKAQSSEKQFTFLDNAAVSQMPQQVIDAVSDFYAGYKANPHSTLYTIGERAAEAYENARAAVARFLNVFPEEIIFTSGATASLNAVARMLGQYVHAGDEIMVSRMEHHSNFIPWQELAKRTGAIFTVLPLENDGALSLETVRRMITSRTKIVAITHTSHVIGVINDVRGICRIACEAGALSVVDAAQSVPHMPVNARDIDCDFLAFSGQKILGPTGIGVLFGKKEHLEKLEPAQFGGGMIRAVDEKNSVWADVPQKFEAGTPHVAGAIGLGAAIRYIEQIGMPEVYAHERHLAAYARRALSEINGVRLYGPCDIEKTAGIVSFTVQDSHPHDIAEILSCENIAVRAGHHCALPLMKHFGVPGTVRASFYIYNTEDDVRRLAEGVTKAVAILQK